MLKNLLSLFLCLLSSQLVLAQGSVSGQVLDAESGTPLEFTTVSLLQGADSTLITGGYTDSEGKFTIEAKPGLYMIKLQFVSYDPKVVSDVQIGNSNKNMGAISLAENTSTLAEVVVEGKREQMELELDKRVFNVAQDLSNTGRNASEILDNLPSVTVDVEGNVSLRGSGNVRILVDGKPSGLIGIGNTDGLRTLNGDVIERVEVVTNPSARYDAEGSAGIINIVLKKKKKAGLNGSFTANVGTPENYGASVNLNYRQSKMNFFVNYGVNYRRTPGMGSSYQEFNGADTSYITRRENDRLRGGISSNIRLGTDFIFNEYNTLTASALYNVSDQDNNTDTWYRDFTTDNDLIQRTLRTDREHEDEENQEYELYYKRTYKKKGREFTANVQFRQSAEIEDADQNEFEGFEEMYPTLVQRSLNDENERQWLIQADYVYPFLENAKFETGVRNTLRQIDNEYIVEEQEESGDWVNLPGFTNTFNYDENIYAAYAILSNKTGKWSYQGGLRAEATDITTHLIQTDEKNDKDYINLFPSAFLTYSLSKTNSLQASYSRRINRPRFRELNPFSSFTDARNIRTGNPDLDPEFTDSYELGYLYNYATGNIYFGAYYRFTDDVVERVRWTETVDSVVITFTRPENLSTQNAYGFELNGSKDLFSWWNVNANFNFYRSITEGEFDGLELFADTYSASGRFTSKWEVPKLFDVQFSGFYRAPEVTTQGRRKAYYSLDLGATKDVFQKKGTLSLSVRDILNSRKFRYETITETLYEEAEFQRAQRQLTLSFTYRLNDINNRMRGGRGGGGYDGGNDDMDF
ncbi:outer membrane receptor protein involved in Fe transport [Catalinimonas alkaloidigena]|uniref:outer membrane beta-barrel family protein n=1 Tax=Catalinimonas alkaloidigena TaxID=1075417 RepID=UPI002404FD8F|nr:outer membrane beta-barrel family protein [Catalinimonas alkaloidigena]MDF9798290.1 outer membrane receptor protein involved in Fe transport [Catalinimonas alkaloidigena]